MKLELFVLECVFQIYQSFLINRKLNFAKNVGIRLSCIHTLLADARLLDAWIYGPKPETWEYNWHYSLSLKLVRSFNLVNIIWFSFYPTCSSFVFVKLQMSGYTNHANERNIPITITAIGKSNSMIKNYHLSATLPQHT